MSAPLLSELREPPVVGRFYMVPVIEDYAWCGRIDAWPVIGPLHTDADFFKFTDPHYHIDARFMTARQETTAASMRHGATLEGAVGSYPLSNRYRSLPKGLPVLRRRKCRRASYSNACTARPEVMALQEHFGTAPAAIVRPDGKLLCPHRKADLSQFPADADGIVTCPLHGLRVCVRAS